MEQKQVKFDFDLKRNIVFLDLETTGINFFYDRIIEISVVKLFTDKSSEIKTRDSIRRGTYPQKLRRYTESLTMM